MKNILYIKASSKPDDISTSKIVSKKFIEVLTQNQENYNITELDLYSAGIPEPNYKCFESRATLVTGEKYEKLDKATKDIVDKMNSLSDQFLQADIIIIASPMWSLSFPSVLKRYLDCIILNNKLIFIDDKNVKGLLNYKDRTMIYIQSSGGDYPNLMQSMFNPGISYIESIFKFLGINTFKKLLIEGTEMSDIGKEKAIEKGLEDIEVLAKKIK